LTHTWIIPDTNRFSSPNQLMHSLCASELRSFFWLKGCRNHWPCDTEKFEQW